MSSYYNDEDSFASPTNRGPRIITTDSFVSVGNNNNNISTIGRPQRGVSAYINGDTSFQNSFINEHPLATAHEEIRQRTGTVSIMGRPRGLTDKMLNKYDDCTLDDAFRAIQRGCEAEDSGRYKEALTFFMDGGEMLTTAANSETNKQVKNLLLHKAYEILEWSEALTAWMETKPGEAKTGECPQRIGQTVATMVPFDSKDHEDIDLGELMYYTPVRTKNPANFTNDNYTLQCIKSHRRPTLLVVITMYNEDASELSSTLRKVCNNVQYLTDASLPGYEGEDAWKNVLVCIVSDGRSKANPGTLEYLHTIGLFDEAVMTITSTGVDVQLHLFERVVNLNKAQKNDISTPFPPLQTLFALKEHNAGKLNSHLWYFNAFANQVDPEYTLLLDVGTMPTKSAFYRLLSNMEINPQIGGVCGEIAVDKPIPNLGNFIVAAQHYEYKVSNILDKSMESCFGYISVLPGAFSAYRFRAIKGPPLDAYFKSLTTPMAELGPFQGNMYLAEDRILGFEVLARKDCNWTMHYVKDAIARTDVPTNLTSLIAQRRRWLNGSFFAMLFGLIHWYRVYTESGHSYLRKLAFTIQYMYMLIQVCLNWFLPSAFHLAIYYVVVAGFKDDEWGFMSTKNIPEDYKDLLSAILNGTYGVAFFTQIIMGLGNKPKHVEKTYIITAIYFAILMSFAFVIAVLIFLGQSEYTNFTIFFASAILGVYFVAAAIHCEIHHICMAFFQYVLLLPTFVNVLGVYSFCNLHDLSWGTKGIDSGGHGDGNAQKSDDGKYTDVVARKKAEEARKRKEAEEADAVKRSFDSFRSNLLLAWLFCNAAMIGGCIYFVPASIFLPILYVAVGAFNIFRFLGSAGYLLYLGRQWLVFQCFLRCGTLKRRHDVKKEERLSVNSHKKETDLESAKKPTLTQARIPMPMLAGNGSSPFSRATEYRLQESA